MLLILFQLGDKPFAIDALSIEMVVPVLPLRKIPSAPSSIAGVYEHFGQIIPVVDLCMVIDDTPARQMLSTRFLICKANGDDRLLGLLAEKVTETCEIDESELKEAGVESKDAPYLGKVFRDKSDRMVQCITPTSVLPQSVLDALNLDKVVSE
ncbi:chemotaxis protein CheW [Rubellicoccus peritrichatus]|uniref:Chemotaxis protein CheW n=1 Tax=Rubellicoccus peritrichatus TaxID=3080537 RepID=A0AAQ3L5Q2_9BACT|nr:chemotaxis protein CheW [Puniceicoccus sp. CR14]WOO39695.1 chemotaxis protein CheW [Puniceicoccus sp. CR14]